MKISFEVTRGSVPAVPQQKGLNAVHEGRGWYPLIRDWFAGAWQKNEEIDLSKASTFYADFACKTLIAHDAAKLRVKYVEEQQQDVWVEKKNTAYDPVLRKPNPYQNRIQFWEAWFLSKLSRGNTYALKQRDERGVVKALYVLDPDLVTPLVSDDGSVFYRLRRDNLTGLESEVIVPAREIIHDRWNCLFHPLVGIPPIYAHGRACQQGLNIQNQSIRLFKNNASPGGILTAPGEIGDADVTRLKEMWEQRFGGENFGRLAVFGSGMKYEKVHLTAVEGQLIEQLKWTAEVVCSVYHVPPYKIGVGALPSYNNIQALNVDYYSNALQYLIESAELCLDEGLGMGIGVGTEFDIDNLLRMDTVTQAEVITKLAGGATWTPDEGRAVFGKSPIAGGDTVYKQHQDYSIAALAKRDARPDPFAKDAPAPTPAADNDNSEEEIAAAKQMFVWRAKDNTAALAERIQAISAAA